MPHLLRLVLFSLGFGGLLAFIAPTETASEVILRTVFATLIAITLIREDRK